MRKIYVQYGCGFSAPEGWLNFDVSPTLRAQRIPLLGPLLKGLFKTRWPASVRYGDILRNLKGVTNGSCSAVYCSHVLEHLSLEDFRLALKNTHAILAEGAVFRLVVPDLGGQIEGYHSALNQGQRDAAIRLVKNTLLGMEKRPRGLRGFIREYYGNARHLWMWDEAAMTLELEKAGFTSIRRCNFGDSADPMFAKVEAKDRFESALAMEAFKPQA